MIFSKEYFKLTPEERAEVEIYATFKQEGANEPGDERYYAKLYEGLPFSNAFYIHEREEIRRLRQIGVDPLAPDIHEQLKENLPCYDYAHRNGIRAEFHYYKMLAEQAGLNIPIPVLILFAPTEDPINRYDFLAWYKKMNHGDLTAKLYDFSIHRLGRRISTLPNETVPSQTQKNARHFFRGLLKQEPLWRNIYIVQ